MFPRGGSLLPSSYADVRYIDGVIAIKGHTLQLRVHTHSFVKTQKQTFVGEVLLCIQTIVQTTRALDVRLQLEDGQYTGSIGEIQHLIKQRSLSGDAEALSLAGLYSDI